MRFGTKTLLLYELKAVVKLLTNVTLKLLWELRFFFGRYICVKAITSSTQNKFLLLDVAFYSRPVP